MGNVSRSGNSSPPITRQYETILDDILSKSPKKFITSYTHGTGYIPYGQISNWVTYSLSSSSSFLLHPNERTFSEKGNVSKNSDEGITFMSPQHKYHETSIYEGDRSRMARRFVRDSCKHSSHADAHSYLQHCDCDAFSFEFLNQSRTKENAEEIFDLDQTSSSPSPKQSPVYPFPCEEYGDIQTTSLYEDYETTAKPSCILTGDKEMTQKHCSLENPHSGTWPRSMSMEKAMEERKSHRMAKHDHQKPHFVAFGEGESEKRNWNCWKKKIPIYGALTNHKPFLEPDILDFFVPFILDSSLLPCLSTCPHWFATIYLHLKQRMTPIAEAFILAYSESGLKFLNTTLSIQPLFTANSQVVRIDMLIYCKILPQCVNRCNQIGYSFSYVSSASSQAMSGSKKGRQETKEDSETVASLTTQMTEGRKDNMGSGAEPTDDRCHVTQKDTLEESGVKSDGSTPGEVDESQEPDTFRLPPPNTSSPEKSKTDYFTYFRFETLKKHSRRNIWICRDICRFHGDELMVANLASVPTVNVDDILEIPVNISNAFGLVNLNSVTWDTLECITLPAEREFGQTCDALRKNQQWFSLDTFQPTTNERLQINDFFSPQWVHLKTEFTGVDITYTRSAYIASETGEVPQSRRWLGIQSIVFPRKSPIICPLTRLGLQHDRFSPHIVRQGDIIILYILQGGPIDV